MLKKATLILISSLLVITAVGCSRKEKQQSTVNSIEKPVVEDKVQKESESNTSEVKDKEDVKEENKPADNTTNNKPAESAKPNEAKPVTKPQEPKPEPEKPKPETIQPEITAPKDPNPEPQKPEVSKPEEPQKVSPKVNEIAEKIIQEVEFGRLVSMPEDLSTDFYPFDRNLVSEYVIHFSMINVNSDEIAIFKVKDAKSLAEIEKGIQKRLEQLDKTWSHYLPAQYDKVKQHIIIKKDNYIMFTVSSNQDKVREVFNGFFSK
jgi:hypothetical protein